MNPIITPDMSVLDIVSRYRQTETVFKRYDALAGECICCNSLFETLAAIALKYGFDVNDLIEELKAEAFETGG